jgi:hypothetical protein
MTLKPCFFTAELRKQILLYGNALFPYENDSLLYGNKLSSMEDKSGSIEDESL